MDTNHKQLSSKKQLVLRLQCHVHNYDWGRLGRDSRVATLLSSNSGIGSELIDPDKPYAEFWMGTHGSGPSRLSVDNVGREGQNCHLNGAETSLLKDWIVDNPEVLGDKVLKNWGRDLPFLFKVLSVAKALSIQAHPDKELARALHKSHPNVYKDDNHKPEMALAVTEFEALCGFIGIEELKRVLKNVPEIVELVGSDAVERYLLVNDTYGVEKVKSMLQSIFSSLMSANKERVSEAVYGLKARLQLEKQVRQLTEKELVVLRLEKQYPGDIGVMSAFLLNYVKLKPGEALYLGANEPHAYVFGECIECMAASDNVVRAGLTPKLRDVQTLCSMLTYKQGYPEILRGLPLNSYIKRYLPPFDEFEVDHCNLPRGASTAFPTAPGPSIFLVMSGEGTMHNGLSEDVIAEGDVLFAPADAEISVSTVSGMQLYRSGVSSRFFLAPSF